MTKSIRPILLLVLGLILIVSALVIFFTNPFERLGQGGSGNTTATAPVSGEEFYPDIRRVSLGDAYAAYQLKQAVFVDTRSLSAYNQSHIPGAVSIPVEELEGRLGELKKTDWIITYCT